MPRPGDPGERAAQHGQSRIRCRASAAPGACRSGPGPAPVAAAAGPTGPRHIVEQGGRIRIAEGGGTPEHFLDIARYLEARSASAACWGWPSTPPMRQRALLCLLHQHRGRGGAALFAASRTTNTGRIRDRVGVDDSAAVQQPQRRHAGLRPDGYLYVASGDGGGNDPRTTASHSTCWARCGSMWMAPRRTPFRPTTPLWALRAPCRRSGPTACAIRGA